MCSEHRATFQRTTMEEDGSTHTSYCVTLNKVQAVVAILVGLTVLIGSVVGAVSYINHSVEDTAEKVFQDQLEEYHTVMRPQLYDKVEGMIQKDIGTHAVESSAPIEERLDNIETRLTTLEASIPQAIDRNTEIINRLDAKNTESINRLDTKIDRILERLR